MGRIGYFFADFGLEDSIVALGPPAGTNYERRTLYKGYLCLPVGNFVLRMKDLEGDGICCDFAEGYFTVKVNGIVVAENDPDNDSYTVQDFPFEITSSGVDTSSPTGSPTYSPTEVNEICSAFVDSCEEYSEFLPALAGMDTGTEAEYDMLVAACEGYTVCCESVETTDAAFAACWNKNCPKLTDESTEEEITECFLSLANGND